MPVKSVVFNRAGTPVLSPANSWMPINSTHIMADIAQVTDTIKR